ncbi:MAG: 7-cyano-7-deazaguanine/7-aminomethyl-7-deazaguanine transporter [Succinivibrio sp.]|jgi:uncharacterized integral membrane protein (TIGR00697 family)|nr:7-cyano-7-deazaguanine/7-aminomethyl-7-deazaguanine transporter [Succinivibrio sp.]
MNDLSFPSKKLWFTHIFIIVLSNFAVQIPLMIGGVHTTLGTFTYPFIFLTTDLTTRIFGQKRARRIVFMAMIPALALSYIFGTLFEQGQFRGFAALGGFNLFVFRIALASFSAYVLGQLADILVFQRLRRMKQWWPAPAASSIFGNLLDTYVFFAVAFYACPVPFMAEHWVEIANVDYLVKVCANLSIFVPIYGAVLAFLSKYVLKRPLTAIA